LFDRATFFLANVPPPSFYENPGSAGTADGRTRVRVLVVDDEQLIAQTVAAILNQNGFDAVAAFSGDEALETARRTRPDIVLSDVLMPRMSGVELGIQMRQELPETRVVLFSGQAATTELMRKAHDAGYSFELVPKPIHPDALVARLRDGKDGRL
jgi:DNA-binding response OmpR family regulator